MTIEQAIEVFVRGFTFTRSFTYPYQAEQAEGAWVMRDAYRPRGDYRCEEYVAYGLPPPTLDKIAREHARGGYRICVIRAAGEPDDTIRAGFRALRYRLMSTEPFMTHTLADIATVDTPLPVMRVTAQEEADRLMRAARSRQVLPEHLTADPPPLRQYMAVDGDTPIGWVRSIAAGDGTWCSNLFVQPAYRRRGVARALLTRMLVDDRSAGARASVLLASHTGAKLYPMLGYHLIGELLAFTPPRQVAARTPE